jgi:kynureninase
MQQAPALDAQWTRGREALGDRESAGRLAGFGGLRHGVGLEVPPMTSSVATKSTADLGSPMPAGGLTREALADMDAQDPLASLRERYRLPPGIVYLDGNSLGAMPKATPARVAELLEQEWGNHLIGGWTKDGWMTLPERLGDRLAQLIGARSGEVLVCDTTSINLFKLVAAALSLRPGRRTVLSDTGNFPTDVYMADGLIDLLGRRHRLKLVAEGDVAAAIDDDTAVVMLTHVNYRSGWMHDMAAVTRVAHARGALVIWDLAHSAGALPVDLTACEADFAVGCGYKYLNAGPGAPGFLYVAKRHQDRARQPLTGWLGHAEPFLFELDYRPAPGIQQFKCSSPPILGLAALEVSLELLLDAGIDRIRAKSVALTDAFIRLVEDRLDRYGFRLASPRAADRRGSQVCFAHPDGYAIMQALIARGAVGDFRAPDILRFGFAPSYNRFVEVWDTVAMLVEIMEGKLYDTPEFRRRKSVT